MVLTVCAAPPGIPSDVLLPETIIPSPHKHRQSATESTVPPVEHRQAPLTGGTGPFLVAESPFGASLREDIVDSPPKSPPSVIESPATGDVSSADSFFLRAPPDWETGSPRSTKEAELSPELSFDVPIPCSSLEPAEIKTSLFVSSDVPIDEIVDPLLPDMGHHVDGNPEFFSKKFCERPGCSNRFCFDPHVPHKRYCGNACYDAVRLARKRLLHWHRLTGCVFVLEIYRLLGSLCESPR